MCIWQSITINIICTLHCTLENKCELYISNMLQSLKCYELLKKPQIKRDGKCSDIEIDS